MQSIKRKYNLNIQGVLSFDNDTPIVSIADHGEYNVVELLKDFEDREVKISVSFDEDYSQEVDDSTGEII